MKIYLFAALLSFTTLGYGLHTEKHRWGLRANQSNVGVIDGKKASIESFPYLVSIEVQEGFLGSGVILNENWILTTAFIVVFEELSDVKIRIGSEKYNSGGKIVQADQIIIPSTYNGDWNSDIALIKVKKPMKFGKTVKSVRLGSKELRRGKKVTIAGWGSTSARDYDASNNLMTAKLTVMDQIKCAETYSSTSKVMCTFDKHAGPSTLDFGDPVIVKKAVYGLFAGASDLVPGDYPMIYTDITKYHKWIQNNTLG